MRSRLDPADPQRGGGTADPGRCRGDLQRRGVDNAFGVRWLPAPSLSVGGASGASTPPGQRQRTVAGPRPSGTSGDHPLIITPPPTTSAPTPMTSPLTVAKATSSSAVASSQNPSRTGDPVTLTASVWRWDSTVPSSSFDGATSLGTGTLVGGQATWSPRRSPWSPLDHRRSRRRRIVPGGRPRGAHPERRRPHRHHDRPRCRRRTRRCSARRSGSPPRSPAGRRPAEP